MSSSPSFADVQGAARRLEGVAVRTPLLEAPRLSALFFLICMAGLVQFEERRHRPRQLEAKGIASMPGETYVE